MSFDLLFNVVWLLKRDFNTWLENIVRTSVCLRYSEEKSELRVIQVSRELSYVSFNQLIPRLFHVKILNQEPFAILYASSNQLVKFFSFLFLTHNSDFVSLNFVLSLLKSKVPAGSMNLAKMLPSKLAYSKSYIVDTSVWRQDGIKSGLIHLRIESSIIQRSTCWRRAYDLRSFFVILYS